MTFFFFQIQNSIANRGEKGIFRYIPNIYISSGGSKENPQSLF